MDRLASINAFVMVAESGGFSAAARRLNLSKATVSDQVQALENALGVRLLNRTTRRVSLTEVGREYYERCSQILHDLAEADEAAGAAQLTPRGQLRVYCHQGIGGFVAPVVTGFLARYPEASVDLRTGDVMIDLVEEGFNLAISPLPPPDSTLVRRRLATARVILCCAPSYLENHPAPQCPSDLAGHKCLRYPYARAPDEWHFVDARGNAVVARVAGNLVTNSIETMRAAAVAGIGLAMLPPFVASDLLASGALVPLLPDYQTPELEIVALYPHRRHMTAKVRAFIDMLVDRFAAEQPRFDPAYSRSEE
jgi:DNA-binding transcriptional LysR family regulator